MSGYDCATCGACCDLRHAPKHFGSFGEYVDIRQGDVTPPEFTHGATLGRGAGEGTRGKYGFMIFTGVPGDSRPVKCAAHEGEPGKHSRCTIYERRPDVCHEVPPGEPLCVQTRLWAGISPAVPPGGFAAFAAARAKGWLDDPDSCARWGDAQRLRELAEGAVWTPSEAVRLDSRWSGKGWIRFIRLSDPETGAAEASRRQRLCAVERYPHLGKPVMRGTFKRLRRKEIWLGGNRFDDKRVAGAFRRHYLMRAAAARDWKSDFPADVPAEPHWKSWRRRLHAETGRPQVFGEAPPEPQIEMLTSSFEKGEIYDEHAALDVAAEAA